MFPRRGTSGLRKYGGVTVTIDGGSMQVGTWCVRKLVLSLLLYLQYSNCACAVRQFHSFIDHGRMEEMEPAPAGVNHTERAG
jgi:hypothetical protein